MVQVFPSLVSILLMHQFDNDDCHVPFPLSSSKEEYHFVASLKLIQLRRITACSSSSYNSRTWSASKLIRRREQFSIEAAHHRKRILDWYRSTIGNEFWSWSRCTEIESKFRSTLPETSSDWSRFIIGNRASTRTSIFRIVLTKQLEEISMDVRFVVL